MFAIYKLFVPLDDDNGQGRMLHNNISSVITDSSGRRFYLKKIFWLHHFLFLRLDDSSESESENDSNAVYVVKSPPSIALKKGNKSANN